MEPWILVKTNPERVKTVLHICLQITANLTIAFEPFLPFTMNKLRSFLNLEKQSWGNLGSRNLLKEGDRVNAPELLFEKIEDDAIQRQVDKLLATKKSNEQEQAIVAPAKPHIEYDDFAKMDIRTGTILAAEKVAKTKKLMKLTIQTGIDKRTVVSGIAEHYEPEQIIGQRVSVLVNLAPKNLKGIESQGMILMAEGKDGKLVFVVPGEEIDNGAEIK